MANYSSISVYCVGAPLVFTGLSALRNPLAAHSLFGVPSPQEQASLHQQPASGDSSLSSPMSPFVYAKAVRDVALGLTCLGLQYLGNNQGVTVMLAGIVFTGLCDGWIVWTLGGGKLQHKAWGHWVPTVGVLVPWVAMRALA
ncbi:hypothetical protein BGZ63DRAFT_381804 [Mariannaea sp. PMI_226]|nr:hypothetical protein BGZ63DRAFT_381804 [Mariannaea sp. PMI_226]